MKPSIRRILSLAFLMAATIPAATIPAATVPARAQDSDMPWTADPALVKRLSKDQKQAFNYRESEVPEFDLPSVLGPNPEQATAENWPQRRQVILDQFRQHVYGYRPTIEANIEYRRIDEAVDPTGGKAVGSKIECVISKGSDSFTFPFLLYRPTSGEGPFPLVIFINNRDFPDPQKMMREADDFWPLEMIIDAGFAAAVFHTSDVDPDRADGYTEGVRGFLAGNEPRQASDWGALSAWGWAASRVLDYAAQHPAIDEERVAVVGHSRGGKTALWAAAEDPRFAIAYSNESGCGGAALSRRRFGETVGRITSAFPHWFAEKFAEYSEKEDQLPVDQHQVIALIAPRAVYVASAADDLWADPRGEYLSLVYAAPVYQLLGFESITDPTMPPLEQQRIVGKTGYHIRAGGHGLLGEDWQRFLKFAQLQFSM